MEAENIVFRGGEGIAADQAEIGDVLLHFAAVGYAVVFAVAELELHAAQGSVLMDAVLKAAVAGAKYGSKDAIAGYLPAITAGAQSISMAMRTGRLRERNCL